MQRRSEGSSSGSRSRSSTRFERTPRRKICQFCHDHVNEINYKDASRFMKRFISDRGKIEPRRKTGTCAKHQRRLSTALKQARFMALLPYTAEHMRNM